MFAAARVMAAGKAGLESLPYFVDELLAQGIPQLAFWAADHSSQQIEYLREATRERRGGAWGDIYELGKAEPGLILQPDTSAAGRLLSQINPVLVDPDNPDNVDATDLADNPAQLAAYCRLNIEQHCRDTVTLWDRFKYNNGIPNDQKLAVVIPFCPEGPTSGTVGMYLGAALRRHFDRLGRKNELVVWGVELCPPVDKDDTDDLNGQALLNGFRGYVARDELLKGVPLTADSNDEDLRQPFDITIVFDGGATKKADPISREDIWQALDRAAAQATACLLNGAAGGDVSESTYLLRQGKRWNAYLAHVVSESAYGKHSRYLHYHVRLPWNRSPADWEKEPLKGKKEVFLRRIDEVNSMLASEPDPSVVEDVKKLVERGEELRAVKRDNWFQRLRGDNKDNTEEILRRAQQEDQSALKGADSNNPAPERLIAKTDPFCINISLPKELRLATAEKMRDNGVPAPVTDLLGASGELQVRGQIQTRLLQGVLERSDCKSVDIDSQAYFESIIAISIENRSLGGNNKALQPTREFLRDFISAELQKLPGTFNEIVLDLGEKISDSEEASVGGSARPRALTWRPPQGVEHDIPVEYSFLTLARCRQQDGFRDISAYDELKEIFEGITSDLARWKEHARYYGVKLPPELLDRGSSGEPYEADKEERPNGHWAHAEVQETQVEVPGTD